MAVWHQLPGRICLISAHGKMTSVSIRMRCKAYVAGEIPPDGGGFAGRDWGKFDIQKEIIDLCPTQCMQWDGKKMSINNAECNRCMHCIDAMPEALRVGADQGVSILFGAKAPILEGAQMGMSDNTIYVCEQTL